VQQAKASAGHSSEVTAGCTDRRLTLGLASTQPQHNHTAAASCKTALGHVSRTSSSRGLRAWREAVPPLTRVFSCSSGSSTVRSSSTTSPTVTSRSLTTSTVSAPAAPWLASTYQGDRHAGTREATTPTTTTTPTTRELQLQPKQALSLRLWRSDRMWTPGAGSSGETRASWVGAHTECLPVFGPRRTLTMGRRRQDSELAESLSLVRSQVSLLKRLIRV
jgi:hypothetical protein